MVRRVHWKKPGGEPGENVKECQRRERAVNEGAAANQRSKREEPGTEMNGNPGSAGSGNGNKPRSTVRYRRAR